MKARRWIWMVTAVVMLPPVVFGDTKPVAAWMPDLPSADMRLSWQDFRQLLEVALELERERAGAAEDKEKEEEATLPADLPWAIVEAFYDADATHGSSVLIRAQLRLYVWERDWVQIPLFGVDVGLESVTLNEQPAPVVLRDNRHVLPINEPGEHLVEVVFSVRAPLDKGVAQLAFDGPEAPRTRMKLRLPDADARVSAAEATRIARTPRDKTLEAELVFRRGKRIEVQWTIPAALPAPPKVEVVQPRFTVATTTLAAVTEKHTSCDTQLQIDLLRGEVDKFVLTLPAAAQILKLEGKGASWRAEEENGEQRITIALNHKVADHYPLVLQYETAIAPGAATLALPRLRVNDAARHSGYVAVITQGNVEVDHHEETEGLRRVDASDLPAPLTERADRPVLHAFHYADENHLLALSYRRMQDVPVRVAGIDRARIRSVVTEEGLVITQAQYLVRNNLKQFLELGIGADAEVWTAMVNGKPVRPARNIANDGDEAVSADVVLLPLIKSQDGDVDHGAFPVEITYMQRFEPLQEGRTVLSLQAPTTDLLVNLVEWEVLTPDQYRVLNAEGDIRQIAQDTPWYEAVARRYEGAYTVVGNRVRIGEEDPRQFTTLHRLREGVERFMITDINNPGASAIAQGPGRYDGAKRTSLPELPAPTAAATVAGALPVPFTMPVTGRPLFFERTVLPQQTPVNVTLELQLTPHRAEWLLALAGGAVLLGFAASAATRAFFRRQFRRYGYLLLAMAVFAGLCAGVLLLNAAVMPLLRNVVAAMLLGLVAPLLFRSGRQLLGRLRHE